MVMVSPKQCNSRQALVRLWLHESLRVFHDRLVDDQDKSHLRSILLEMVNKHLSTAVTSPQDLLPQGSTIIFGDFLKAGLNPAERPYEEVSHLPASLLPNPLKCDDCVDFDCPGYLIATELCLTAGIALCAQHLDMIAATTAKFTLGIRDVM